MKLYLITSLLDFVLFQPSNFPIIWISLSQQFWWRKRKLNCVYLKIMINSVVNQCLWRRQKRQWRSLKYTDNSGSPGTNAIQAAHTASIATKFASACKILKCSCWYMFNKHICCYMKFPVYEHKILNFQCLGNPLKKILIQPGKLKSW